MHGARSRVLRVGQMQLSCKYVDSWIGEALATLLASCALVAQVPTHVCAQAADAPPAAPVVAMKATPTDRMRSLEDRVAALERWRDGAKT